MKTQTKKLIKFGTDGWRGIIAQDFTFDNVRIAAQAFADHLKESGLASKGVIIGYDTRFASEDFAAAAAEVTAANGIKTLLCQSVTPTPIVSYGVLAYQTGGGIVITASHNAAQWNGFKLKTEGGTSAPAEVINNVEGHITRILATGGLSRIPLTEALTQKTVEYVDPVPPYVEQIKKLVDIEAIKKAGIKIVLDPMYGAGAGCLKSLLDGNAAEVLEINGQRNPIFPGIEQPEPIAQNLAALSQKVVSEKADIGIATDGDADRVGIVDENGVFVTQLQVFALLALYLLKVRGQRGALVKTITSTSMLYQLGKLYNVPVHETPVGFKYVAPVMLSEKAIIGGEESGGFGFAGHVLERDAIVAAFCFLDFMAKTGKKPSELLDYLYSKVGPHHYHRTDVVFSAPKRQNITARLDKSQPEALDGSRVVKKDTFDGYRFTLADGSWLLIRFSGTEPLMRIYAESNSPARVEKLLKLGRKLAEV